MECPFCKEDIKDGAIKCRHCGSMLVAESDDAGETPVEARPARRVGRIVYVILGILGGVAVAWLDFSNPELRTARAFWLWLVGGIEVFIVGPIGWKIGDAFRKFAHPDLVFAGGAIAMARQKLFWMVGPQILGYVLSIGISMYLICKFFFPDLILH